MRGKEKLCEARKMVEAGKKNAQQRKPTFAVEKVTASKHTLDVGRAFWAGCCWKPAVWPKARRVWFFLAVIVLDTLKKQPKNIYTIFPTCFSETVRLGDRLGARL